MTSAETNRKDIYAKWAKEYKESIVISKENDYYIGRGDAMPILSDLFGNKLKKIISDDDIALGSPNLNKITSKLEEQYISYIVVNGDVIVRERSFKNNFWNRYKKNEVPVNHTAKTEGNITTSLSLDKKFNNISVGMQLFCKMRGPVIVSKVEEELFYVSFDGKTTPQHYFDMGKLLFFTENDLRLYKNNSEEFPVEVYEVFKEKTLNKIKKQIDEGNRDFFEGMTYHEKELYKEEKHFYAIEDFLEEELKVAELERQGIEIINNGNSEMYDPDVQKKRDAIIIAEKDLVDKKNEPYYVELIERNGLPIYIGKKAIPGKVVDERDRRYADKIKLREYRQANVELIREFDIFQAFFKDFKDIVNIHNNEDIVIDPFLLKVMEYNRNEQRMVNITRTIREDQYKVIIRPIDENFVVEGCAGSGKTMMLLHRLSSLVFNEDDFSAENCVIVSPNSLLDSESKEIVKDFEIEKAEKGSIFDLYLRWLRAYFKKYGIFKNLETDLKERFLGNDKLNKETLAFVYSSDFVNEFGDMVRVLYRDHRVKLSGFHFETYEKERIQKNEKAIFGGLLDTEENINIYNHFAKLASDYEIVCNNLSMLNAAEKLAELEKKIQLESSKLKEFPEEKKKQIKNEFEGKITQMSSRYDELEKELADILHKKYSIVDSDDKFVRMINEEKRAVYNEDIQRLEGELNSLRKNIKSEKRKYTVAMQDAARNKAYETAMQEYKAINAFYKMGHLKGDVVREDNLERKVSLANTVYKEAFDFYKKYSGKTHTSILERHDSEAEFWSQTYLFFERKKRYDLFLGGERKEYIVEFIESVISFWKEYFSIANNVRFEFERFLLLKGIQSIFGTLSNTVKLVSFDEYQDYAPAEIELVKKIYNNPVINLYGDPFQRINNKTDEEIDKSLYEKYTFDFNYRNGREITEYINDNLGTSMEAIGIPSEVKTADVSFMSHIEISGNKRIALIVKSEEVYQDMVYDKRNDRLFKNDEVTIDKSKLNVIPVRLAKGMEFEDVYVYDCEFTENERYVAYTRALNSLTILRG